MSRPQVSTFTNGSVYLVPPLIVPFVEKSSVKKVSLEKESFIGDVALGGTNVDMQFPS